VKDLLRNLNTSLKHTERKQLLLDRLEPTKLVKNELTYEYWLTGICRSSPHGRAMLTSRLSNAEAVVELYGDMKVVHCIQIKQLHSLCDSTAIVSYVSVDREEKQTNTA